jgi:hypothetical protein
VGERFISFEELAGMTERELVDAALGGSITHGGFRLLIERLRIAREEAKRLQLK